jgi:hypothetical protein
MDKRTAKEFLKGFLKGYSDFAINNTGVSLTNTKLLSRLISEECEARNSKKDREKDYSKEWER